MPRQNHPRRTSATHGGGHNRPPPPPPEQKPPGSITVKPGQTTFRLLCHVFNTGGVIGHSGTIIKNIEQTTSSIVRIQDPVPDCVERVIVVVGSEIVNRTITVRGCRRNVGGDEERWDVSAAQECLIRVLERVFEVEEENDCGGGDDDERCCRLLAKPSQMAVVMGRGGRNVARIRRIRNQTGTRIRVLESHRVPFCADSDEGLIHITGGILAVKKALILVSRCLQDCSPWDKSSSMVVNIPVKTTPNWTFANPHVKSTSNGASADPHAEFFPHLTSFVPRSYTGSASGGLTDSIPSKDVYDTQKEVVFRLICSNNTAGGVIGRNGTLVRILQNETGASINCAAPVAGSDDRLITIFAMENPEMSHSPAQKAAVRVFARFIEVAIENGIISSINNGETVNARLLIASNQVSCLFEEGGEVVSELKKVTGGAEIQILRGNLSTCALENDNVVEITGEYKKVQRALLQVTRRLRDSCFPGMMHKGVGAKSYPLSAIPDINPIRKFRNSAPVSQQSIRVSPDPNQVRIAWGMYYLGLSDKVGGSSPRSPLPLATRKGHISATANGGATTHKGGLELGSPSKTQIGQDTPVKVAVPENAFAFVCGENGGNLKCISQISGAECIMHNPSSGNSEGMIIIYGEPHQIQKAQSLLQALL